MSSSSSSSEPKQTDLPNFYSGHLLARHASRFSSSNPLPCCACCGEAFKEDDEYLIDVYSQEGQTEVQILDKPRKFDRTKVFMAHAKCIEAACVKVVGESTSRVGFSLRADGTEKDPDEIIRIVYEKFKWAVKWIEWHHRFLFTGEETVSMTLGSTRPALTAGLCESFSLGMCKGSIKWQDIKFPIHLISFPMLEGMFTRIYEYDLEYDGPYQPLIQIASALEKSLINTNILDPNVSICAHPVLNSSFAGGGRANDQRVKLFVKAKPPSVCIQSLLLAYEAKSPTWRSLCGQLRQFNANPYGSDEEECELDEHLEELHACFAALENRIESLIEQAGIKMDFARRTTPVSDIKILSTKSKQAQIAFRSNCYVETSKKLNRPYYFFRDVKHESEQPLFCYEGILGGVVPILVSNAQQLAEEMKEARLRLVDIPGLRVLLAHHKGETRVIKQA
jgi:hypothetical protein